MRYEILAAAYHDVEQATGRPAMIDRLAELFAGTDPDAGLALRFPRFTGRRRDDNAAEDATATDEIRQLYGTARRPPAGA